MSHPLFTLEQATFAHPGGTASLLDISFAINAGDHLALLGANGAGKTTLLHLMAALQFATAGSVQYRGRMLQSKSFEAERSFRREFRSKVGVLFQNSDAQLFCHSVQDEIAYGPLQLYSREEALDRTFSLMQMLGIEHLADDAPYALSGGEKRKVALASVLVMEPEILLLDEPTAGLDAATCDFILDWLAAFCSREGTTLIAATHELAFAGFVSNQCAVLTPCHRLARIDRTDEILSDEQLLTSMNLLGRRRLESKSKNIPH